MSQTLFVITGPVIFLDRIFVEGMWMFKRYSYNLSFSSPVWPGNPPAAVVEPQESITRVIMLIRLR